MDYYLRLNSDAFHNENYEYSSELLSLWTKVDKLFKDYRLVSYAQGKSQDVGYKISVDASDIKDFYSKRIFELHSEDYYSEPDCYLKISVRTTNGAYLYSLGGERSLNLINRFLQDLFLAMNLSFPTSFNPWFTEFYESEDSYDVLGYGPFYTSIPLEKVMVENKEWDYPEIEPISIDKVWKWINNVGVPGVGLANNTGQKISFILLSLCSRTLFVVENALTLCRGLEIILADSSQGVSKIIKDRLEVLLGVPNTNKKWFSKIYQLRSRIIHGDLPVTRNSREFEFQNEEFQEEFKRDYYRAFAVFIKLLQMMIIENCNGYEFSQLVKPLKNI